MHLLIDVNLSPLWADTLEAGGHVATHWSKVGRLDAPDLDLMIHARVTIDLRRAKARLLPIRR